MKDDFNPEKLAQKLKAATYEHKKSFFDMQRPQEFQVKLRPDAALKPGFFYPDPLIPGGHKAHPTTIAAVRKDIFVAGEEGFEDLECLYICHSCKTELDLQFWHF